MRNYSLLSMLLGSSVLLILFSLPRLGQAALANNAPLLSIPAGVAGHSGGLVTVPVDFRGGGSAIGSAAFSIDFDESCLALDEGDEDGDGVIDAIRFRLPPAFRGFAVFNPDDTDGEIDVTIADFSPPIAALADQNELVEIDFSVVCTPAAGESMTAAVRFSTAPSITFGAPSGADVSGSGIDGSVQVRAGEGANTTTPAAATPSAPASTPGNPETTVEAPTTPAPGGTTNVPGSTPTLIVIPETPGTPQPNPTTGLAPTALLLHDFAARPGDDFVVLEWSTSSEWAVHGFYLMRRIVREDGTNGPLKRISPLIYGLGRAGGTYLFTDYFVEKDRDYHYQLISVHEDGQNEELLATLNVSINGANGSESQESYLPLIVWD